MKEHLITYEEYQQLSRPTSIHLDEEDVNCYIGECEDKHIVPAIGYDLYTELITQQLDLSLTDENKGLLEGGTYTLSLCGCNGNETKYCYGLKKALSYFVYAKMILADGEQQARAGFVEHSDTYYHHKNDKKDRYNDVMDTAEMYLNSCLNYIKSKINNNQSAVRTTRSHIHAIGD